ncbi:phosphopyruvate hydratase [Curtobacterium sp. ER1/6]|nr:phosphopyruvate hydratase [Curtobacterium sp. ER1/6]
MTDRARSPPSSGPDIDETPPSRGRTASRAVRVLERGGAGERGAAGVDGGVTELLLDAEQLVVLRDAVRAGRGAGLDLATVDGHRDVRDGGVLGLARAVRQDRGHAVALRQGDGVERLGQRADLVHLDQDRVAGLLVDAPLQTLRVRDVQVVADELQLGAELGGQVLPALPVVLGQGVLDGDEGVVRDEVGEVPRELLARELLALERVLAVVEELGRGDVEAERDVLARGEAGLLDRGEQEVERGAVRRELRREAALVAEAGRQALLLQLALEGVVGLDAPAERLREALGTVGHEEELLDVDVGVGVRATVDDVHERHGQGVRVRATEVAEEREVGRVGGGAGHGERGTEDRVRTEARLVLGAVELDERGVDEALVGGVEALERRADLVEHGVDGLEDALAAVAVRVAVTELVRLERTGGGTGRDERPRDDAVVEEDLDLDRRVASGIEDFACAYGIDLGHGVLPTSSVVVIAGPILPTRGGAEVSCVRTVDGTRRPRASPCPPGRTRMRRTPARRVRRAGSWCSSPGVRAGPDGATGAPRP